MADTPEGPGWWQATDGKWYPPELHPNYVAPPSEPPPLFPPLQSPPVQSPPVQPPVSPPGYGPPPGGPPNYAPPNYSPPGFGQPGYGPPAKTGMSGASKALLIIALGLVVLLGGCVVGAAVFINRSADKLDDALGGGSCSFLSDSEASKAAGSDVSLLRLSGVIGITEVALDTRALPDAPSCLLSPEGSAGPTGRVARLSSSRAKELFSQERTKAEGLKEDRGNGLSVETEPYVLKEVDLGDEAFCTSPGLPPSVGVLVRKGDVLVYVSALPDQSQLDSISLNEDNQLNYADDVCELVQRVAQAVLDH